MATLDVLSLAEGKDVLNLTLTSAYDTELAAYITAVSKRLDRLCGPVVQRVITDEELEGGVPDVFLEFYPIISFESVTEYDQIEPLILTPETNFVKPTNAYRRHGYSAISGLYSNRLRRSNNGYADSFGPVVVASYTAGRSADTSSVGELYKRAAGLMLQNLWRSQQDSTGRVDEFDVPLAAFPRFAVPNAVTDLLCDEIQEPKVLLA